jgi:hypothetical protein
VGPRAGLDAGARRKILCPCRGLNPDHPIVQPVAIKAVVFSRKLIVAQLVKKFPRIMEVKGLLACSQEPVTKPGPEPVKSSPHA